MTTKPKKCRFIHRWETLDVFVGMFSLADKCRKCGLCRVTNLLTESVRYGYPAEQEQP